MDDAHATPVFSAKLERGTHDISHGVMGRIDIITGTAWEGSRAGVERRFTSGAKGNCRLFAATFTAYLFSTQSRHRCCCFPKALELLSTSTKLRDKLEEKH